MKINEIGRSMVEMLGVLAIIGVLSVTGIMGYTIAMRNYRANEIAHAVSMFAAALKTANAGSGITGQTDYTDLVDAPSNPRGADELYATSETTIILETETEELCEAVANLFGTDNQRPIYVDANDCGVDGTDDTAEHQLTFYVKQ